MKQAIFLIADKNSGVTGYRKNPVAVRRDEILIKLNLNIPPEAFKPPTIEKEVTIEDWRDGVDIADVEFTKTTITTEEAAIIREKRLATMREVLEKQGFTVTAPQA